jgi:hypothetical protein
MIWTNFTIASVLFFGWFALDIVYSVFLGGPMEGIYYPAASGTLKSNPGDWTHKPWFGAPMYLAIFTAIWIFFVRKEGIVKGLRLAAIVTAFTMAPFWIVSSISTDMYQLDINGYWLATMVYSNISFFVFGFIGQGNLEDLNF